ncbi:MAG: hypothetical protein K9L68_05895 [Spirochaetales bacterium]|nr:hypothetical protein [Spirochaetales bacterium]MCF7938113.1 hypothetical protein [Spirochaetales bacterium]
MKRADFVFTIGYEGNQAVVNKNAARKFGSLSHEKLIEKGLFKEAFSAALYDGDQEGMEEVLNAYNRYAGSSYTSIEQLKRLFGVFEVPEVVKKSLYI